MASFKVSSFSGTLLSSLSLAPSLRKLSKKSVQLKLILKLEKIILHIGNAMEIIPSLQESWDIVFIDADKLGYIDYYELVFPYLKHNGLIIADNVLFHGQVLEENITGKNAVAIHAFNQHVKKDTRVDQTLLTLRDGLLLIRKL